MSEVRPPRVAIKLDVETGKAYPSRELPFVVGVMGDFSGDPTKKLKPLKDRQFVEIGKDNFDDIMKSMGVGLNLKVKNTLQNDGTDLAVNLKFDKMDDFNPANVAEQVPALKQLMDLREKLKTLKAKADGSDELSAILEETAKKLEKAKTAGGDK